MAVVIMGIAFAVILGGIGTAIIGADIQKQQAGADVLVRSAAEAVMDPGRTPYVPCATPATLVSTPALPANATITAVSYWDPGDNQFRTPVPPQTCTDTGLQLIALTATSTGGGRPSTETLQVVKRR